MVEWMAKLLTGSLTPAETRLLMAIGWRVLVSFHMLYACGYLVAIGLPLTGFAQKADVEAQRQATLELKKVVDLQLRLGLAREVRLQTSVFCSTTDAVTREATWTTINRLREDYRQLTGGETLPEPRCF